MEPGICMGDGSSTEDAKSAGMSPLRLRVGVFLILLWIVPFWALALVSNGSPLRGRIGMARRLGVRVRSG
jgi:hypothetical protein